MRRTLVSIISVFVFLLQADADSVLKAFTDKVSESLVAFDYSFVSKLENGAAMTGSGSATVSGDMFSIRGNGLEIVCDGRTRWTMDTEAKEVIVETVSGNGADYLANPALLLSHSGEAFEAVSSGDGRFKGRSAHVTRLRPVTETGVGGLAMYFSGEELIGVEVTAEDGTVTEFAISNLTFSSLVRDESGFRPGRFPEDWVVTDLR